VVGDLGERQLGGVDREADRVVAHAEEPATIKTRVNRIFAKPGSRDRVQAVRYASTHGCAVDS
jgi:hypothetical protein